MNERNFFAELKRRNVYKVAVAYAVVAWLLIQVTTEVSPVLQNSTGERQLVNLFWLLSFRSHKGLPALELGRLTENQLSGNMAK